MIKTCLRSAMNCQNCRKPLKLNDTLEDLDPASFDLLIGLSAETRLNLSLSAHHNQGLPANLSML